MNFTAALAPSLPWDGAAFLQEAAEAERASPAEAADVKASLDGDGEAYERIVRRHQGKVLSWMRRFAREAGEVDELAQDVFVEAYLSLRSYRFQAPFEHWLRKIAVRVGYRLWKERARARRGLPLEEAVLPAEEVPDLTPSQARDLLHRILGKLSPPDRLVLTLLHLEGMSVGEVSRVTGWPHPVVKVRAFRARRRLGTLMEGSGNGTSREAGS